MERVRSQIISNLIKLQEEVKDITAHLNNIVEQNTTVVKEVKSLSTKDLASKSNYFLKVTQQQHAAIQKLLSVNLELEEHLSTNKFENASPRKSDTKHESKSDTSSKLSSPSVDSYSESSDYEKESSDGGNKADNSDMTSDTGKPNGTVVDKLKRMNLPSRRERYERSFPKVPMPDLSFKKAKPKPTPISSLKVCQKETPNNIVEMVEPIKYEVLTAPPELAIGVSCLISYLKSPSEFYVNYADSNIEKLENMSQDVAELYDPLSLPYKTKLEAKNVLGDFCFCYMEKWVFWYRVRVTNWHLCEGEKLVTAFLVDYGHTVDVPYTSLRPLLEEHVKIPQYAIKCHLAYLFPPGSTADNLLEDWPSTSLDSMKKHLGKENEIVYQIVYYHKEGDSYAVDLTKLGNHEDEPTIGQKLIDDKTATEIIRPVMTFPSNGFIEKQIRTAQGLAGVTSDMTEEEVLDTYLKNVDTKELANLDEAVTGFRATDEARTCSQFVRTGMCKRNNCKFDHLPLRKDGYTTDKHEVFTSAFSNLVLPKIGSTTTIRVTSIQKVNLWYGHLLESIEGYAQLNRSLNSTASRLKPLKLLPSLGELVIATYESEGDSTLYRAMVKDVCHLVDNPEPIVQVFLVDTGDTVDVRLSNIRAITKELLTAPFYAVSCTLYKIKENNGVDLGDVLNFCDSRYLNEWLHAEVVYASSSRLTVKFQQYEGYSVSDELVKLGFAAALENDYEPLSIERDLVD